MNCNERASEFWAVSRNATEVDVRGSAVGNVREVNREHFFRDDAVAVHDFEGTREHGADGHGDDGVRETKDSVEETESPGLCCSRKSEDATEVHFRKLRTTDGKFIHGQNAEGGSGAVRQEKEAGFLAVDLGGALVLEGGRRGVVVELFVTAFGVFSGITRAVGRPKISRAGVVD